MLRVKPQITEGGTVRLGIYQEVSRVQDTTRRAGPILTKRALESSVVIDDRQIVVLGGLIQDTLTDGTEKLPYAGDIPVFGALFRYDTRSREKTNLMIFLQADDRAQHDRGPRDHVGALRLPARRAVERRARRALVLEGPDSAPELPPQGTMPGTPQATPIGPPEPRNR